MKRGKPLKRKAPLRRKTWMRSRGKTKYRRRERDTEFMMKVKRLPCIVSVVERLGAFEKAALPFRFIRVTLCGGRVQADHMGKRGLGQKAADRTCVGVCQNHHQERTDYRGTFYGYSGLPMRAFCDWAIGWTQQQIKEMS